MSALTITRIDVKVLDNPTNKIRAYANITISDLVRIKGIKVIDSINGLFVAFPNYLSGDGKRRRIAFLIGEFADTVNQQILDVYTAKTQTVLAKTA